MALQTEIAAHIERLNFWLKVSREKFNLAMDQGHEFEELKMILNEIKDLERALQEYMKKVEV